MLLDLLFLLIFSPSVCRTFESNNEKMIRKNKESMRNRSMAKRKMRTQQVFSPPPLPPPPPLCFLILVSQEQGVDA